MKKITDKSMGKLFGVGVGPGDPELITLKGIRILKEVPYIFTASSTKNDYSLSYEIIKPHLKDTTRVINLGFSMAKDKNIRRQFWEKNSLIVLETLRKGHDAAFVTVGDPLTYSTFGYIMKTLRRLEPSVLIEIIPGVTSYHAAAAASQTILSENDESLLVVSCANGANELKERISMAENVVILKVYRKYRDILEALKELNLLEKAVLVSNCGRQNESIQSCLREKELKNCPPYLSLMITKQKKER